MSFKDTEDEWFSFIAFNSRSSASCNSSTDRISDSLMMCKCSQHAHILFTKRLGYAKITE